MSQFEQRVYRRACPRCIKRRARESGLHAQELLAFAIRVAEFSDYTHDEVKEREILHALQRDAAALVAKVEGRS